MSRQTGLLLAVVGLALVAVGLLAAAGGLGWFGRLPGDIRVERPGFRLYVPVVTMLLLSVVVSVVLWLLRRFF
ncbi:MAG: DUF2905 domain-containing protein [Acidobacteria bacterium]|nr:DUF2905 domain-containing protein [Acidobacteriota bacterium]